MTAPRQIHIQSIDMLKLPRISVPYLAPPAKMPAVGDPVEFCVDGAVVGAGTVSAVNEAARSYSAEVKEMR